MLRAVRIIRTNSSPEKLPGARSLSAKTWPVRKECRFPRVVVCVQYVKHEVKFGARVWQGNYEEINSIDSAGDNWGRCVGRFAARMARSKNGYSRPHGGDDGASARKCHPTDRSGQPCRLPGERPAAGNRL